MNELVFLSGFPRSGSTLLANVLAMHPNCYASPSSPLHSIMSNMRASWSDDTFLLSQLDHDPEGVQKRLKKSVQSFMKSWAHNDKFENMLLQEPDSNFVTIDKNRGWLFDLEWLREVNPNFKIIVTLRRLEEIYRSVERQHRKTLMLDFPDHMSHNMVDARASALFSDQGIVGSILRGLQNVGDIPDIVGHMYFWRYEDFLDNPQQSISSVFDFLGLQHYDIDFDNIVQSTHESDSYYRMKFPHRVLTKISQPNPEDTPISPRIVNEMMSRFSWYYESYYDDDQEQEIITQKTRQPVIEPEIVESVQPQSQFIQEVHPEIIETEKVQEAPKGYVEKTVVNIADISQIARELEEKIEEENRLRLEQNRQ